MKLILFFLYSLFFSSVGYPEVQSEQVRCTGTLLGAPTYSIVLVDPDDEPRYYKLIKTHMNPMADPVSIKIRTSNVIYYKNTFILTANLGRSGYAHVYAHKDTSIIDIDLFQYPLMNTEGPLLDYECFRL